jgi:hypothetical protein
MCSLEGKLCVAGASCESKEVVLKAATLEDCGFAAQASRGIITAGAGAGAGGCPRLVPWVGRPLTSRNLGCRFTGPLIGHRCPGRLLINDGTGSQHNLEAARTASWLLRSEVMDWACLDTRKSIPHHLWRRPKRTDPPEPVVVLSADHAAWQSDVHPVSQPPISSCPRTSRYSAPRLID